jgi:hypothetical protein
VIEWTRINGSRAIRAVGIDPGGTGGGGADTPPKLYVQFKRSGKIYVYETGSSDYFDRFVSAASKGRFYVRVIKARFDYVAKY